jgi:uncharacterized protein
MIDRKKENTSLSPSLFSSAPPGFDAEAITPPPVKNGMFRTTSLALDLAGCCNLACRYCAESATQPRRDLMSPGTLEAAWKFLLPDGVPTKGMSIRLGSGEPLIGFSLMKKLVELQQTIKEPIPVFLTTNGTLIDDEIREWLIASGWNIKISLDGPASIQDKWRVLPGGIGTYERVAKEVTLLAEQIPERFSVTAVLCRGTDPAEAFDGIASLGVRRIELVPVAHKSESVSPGPEDVERYKTFIRNYAHRYLESDEKQIPPELTRFKQRVLRLMGYTLGRITCGAGRQFLGVGPEGDLYPCFRFIGVDNYRLGHIDTGIDTESVTVFQEGAGRPYEQRTPCGTCWAAPLCGGPCFACAEMFGPGDGQPIPLHCQYVLADSEAAVTLVNRLREHNPERLLTFLPNLGDILGE